MYLRSEVDDKESIYGCELCDHIFQDDSIEDDLVPSTPCPSCGKSSLEAAADKAAEKKDEPPWNGILLSSDIDVLQRVLALVLPSCDAISFTIAEEGVRVVAARGYEEAESVYRPQPPRPGQDVDQLVWQLSQSLLNDLKKQ